jgi:hypothetical protein
MDGLTSQQILKYFRKERGGELKEMNNELSLVDLCVPVKEKIDANFVSDFLKWVANPDNDFPFATEFSWANSTRFAWQGTDISHPARMRRKVGEYLWELKVQCHPVRERLLSRHAAPSVRNSLSQIMEDVLSKTWSRGPFQWYDGLSTAQPGALSGHTLNSVLEEQKASVAKVMEAILSIPGLRNEEGALDNDIWKATVSLRQVIEICLALRLLSH